MKSALVLLISVLATCCMAQLPSWQWGDVTTGTLGEGGVDVQTDVAGNVYVLGTFLSPTVTFGSVTLTNPVPGVQQTFVVKYDNTNTVIWAGCSAGSSHTVGTALTVDLYGNVMVTGYFMGWTTFGSYALSLTLPNGPDAFLVKYDANGNVIWAQRWGSDVVNWPFDFAQAITSDRAGNMYVTGSFEGDSLYIGSLSAGNSAPCSNIADVYIAKFDSAGTPLWIRTGTGNSSPCAGSAEYGFGIYADPSGSVYATGHFEGASVTFGSQVLANTSANSAGDVFLVKYDSLGNVIWARSGGGSLSEYGNAITGTDNGDIFIGGVYQSPDPSFGNLTIQDSDSLHYRMYTVKYSSAGVPQWAQSAGMISLRDKTGMAADSSGNVYVIGSFHHDSTIRFGSATLLNPMLNAGSLYSACVGKYDQNGSLIWARPVAGTGYIAGNEVTVSCSGAKVYCTGYFGDTLQLDSLGFISPTPGISNAYVGELIDFITWNRTGDSICVGDSTTFSVSGGNAYLWSNGATTSSITVSPSASAQYSVFVELGCDTISLTFNVDVESLPQQITGTDSLCIGDTIALDVVPFASGCSYMWNTGDTTNSMQYQPSATGIYSVIVSNAACGADTLYFPVVVNPLPAVNAGADITIGYGQTTQLNGSGGSIFSWTPTTTLSNPNVLNPIATPTATTVYILTVTDQNGCVSVDSVTISVGCTIFVPNAFSPNGDRNNDSLKVYGECLSELHWVIYDRWGAKVFESKDPGTAWDGTYKGLTLEPAVFTYVITGTLINNTPFEAHGNVSLVK